MNRASDLSYVYSLQPSSSQLLRDEEAVESAFWQSTPTTLEELRQETEDGCNQAVSEDQDGPNDPLSLSNQQFRVIRETWVSAPAGSISRSSGGGTQMSSRPKYHAKRGGAARPDSTNDITSASTVSSTDKSMTIFRHLKNIEKVSKTVDERMQKRKVQREWSTKVISETARLRDGDEEGVLKENMNTNMHTSKSFPSKDNADIAPQVDAIDGDGDGDGDGDNDHLGLGTTLQSDDRDPELMEEEVIPTSQSQERYLSPLCAPINGSTATA